MCGRTKGIKQAWRILSKSGWCFEELFGVWSEARSHREAEVNLMYSPAADMSFWELTAAGETEEMTKRPD